MRGLPGLIAVVAASLGAASALAQSEGQPAPVEAAPVMAPAPAPPLVVPEPVRAWTVPDAEALLAAIDAVGADGLKPADYAPDALRRALELGDPVQLGAAADMSFAMVSRDLARGAVPPDKRRGWKMTGPNAGATDIARWREEALASGDVAATLERLRPTHPQYAKLKAVLAALPASDSASRALVRTNLERWRWMPRMLGEEYILVNVPGFQAMLVRGQSPAIKHKVIVGKASTPTPQFSTVATGVILNPEWVIPQSIIDESVGRMVRNSPATAKARGYVWSGTGDGLSVRQRPGPGNSLGAMKIDMPNPYVIYLHDTPAKGLFEKEVRAFSHGCIRTHKALDLVDALLPEMDRAGIDAVVATRQTKRMALPKQLPVYVAYFTAAANNDGSISRFPDIYGRDAPVAAALNSSGISPVAPASPVVAQAIPNFPA